ncbi:putative protein isoform X3 [Capsicum galapagoense]
MVDTTLSCAPLLQMLMSYASATYLLKNIRYATAGRRETNLCSSVGAFCGRNWPQSLLHSPEAELLPLYYACDIDKSWKLEAVTKFKSCSLSRDATTAHMKDNQ